MGATLWHPDGASTPLRFPGQYADPESQPPALLRPRYGPLPEPRPSRVGTRLQPPCLRAQPLQIY